MKLISRGAVLLVGAVVLEQLHAPLAEASGTVDELLRDVSLEIAAGDLDVLHGAGLGGGGGGGDVV
jgi:hypothetical protein